MTVLATGHIERLSRREETLMVPRPVPNEPGRFFCNGPQCAATPSSIRTLLGASYPAESILHYRGGIHDWVTLGLPIKIPA